ncbi:MAG: AmmeMemoRadiSam system radical SAM enzyme [Candidatus Omnitrophica bacterium]|nr:AmmeMemoRadiSam system radical SAM enzyme [Candidatus Omnitrophota bacterium]
MTSLVPIDGTRIRQADWEKQDCLGVQCELCPLNCFLPEGSRGVCRVRMNTGGRLRTLVYGQPVSVHVDPIEKKPVYHMLPGSGIFSIATVGCNLRCSFCQNWEISQRYPEEAKTSGQIMTPEQVVDAAIKNNCASIAYTYSEPTVFYEYVLDTARLAKQRGLRNVLVSAGYINRKPLIKLAPYFDVIKIDLKGFNEGFYRKVVGGELKYVLATLKELHDLGVLTEVVNLVVPGLNDNMGEIAGMCKWLYDNMGPDTPLFFSRFGPQYKLGNLPPTPIETLEKARKIAMDAGLRYVYIGNVPGHPAESTYCPGCGRRLIHRYGYAILENNIKNGKCVFCGKEIPGIWNN